jgi:hypothetical protein
MEGQQGAIGEARLIGEVMTNRMSLYIDFIMRSSAALMDCSRTLASHSQASVAGAWHTAQSGSILMTDFRDDLEPLPYILAGGLGPESGSTGREEAR